VGLIKVLKHPHVGWIAAAILNVDVGEQYYIRTAISSVKQVFSFDGLDDERSKTTDKTEGI
jgi:hypothetical protein